MAGTKRRRGFLGAAAFLAAGIACPSCLRRSRHTVPSNFAVASACLRTYAGAQLMYRKVGYDGDGVLEYAFPYTLLKTTMSAGQPIRLIDDSFANASRDYPPGGISAPKGGYLFVDIVGDPKTGLYKDDKGNCVRGHGLCAYPAVYGRTGRWTLIIDAEGTVYAKDTGGVPVTLFPDVEKEGWEASGG